MKGIYLKGIYAGLMAFAVLLFFESTSFTGQKEVSFQLFFTSDVYGYLKPCG